MTHFTGFAIPNFIVSSIVTSIKCFAITLSPKDFHGRINNLNASKVGLNYFSYIIIKIKNIVIIILNYGKLLCFLVFQNKGQDYARRLSKKNITTS
jgi:hypothetical protein